MASTPPKSSPPAPSSPSSLSQKRSRSPLSLDLSSLPALSTPHPPSNTLLITRLSNPKIFHPASLATIREHLTSLAGGRINSFSPLKSMHRIIVSFLDEDAAIRVRQEIDGIALLPPQDGTENSEGSVTKCYFGEPTPLYTENEVKYLERPDQGRLFFISPPPSPPIGWEMKAEDPPNKEVHAGDLASKLQKLTSRMETPEMSPTDSGEEDDEKSRLFTANELHRLQRTRSATTGVNVLQVDGGDSPRKTRSRSSTLIYDPKAHGDSPALPAVMLETEDDDDVEFGDSSDIDLVGKEKPIMAHTARPPVELMQGL
ncbi:hypothetical protein DV738_g3015, partial [Chaetothyriales sp. CBS 135597]